jgi:predicted anti-sigma-YlaC factor YlaD
MNCTTARKKLFSKIDGELSIAEGAELDAHLKQCPSCNREYGLLALPSQIANKIPPITVSPYFYQKLRMQIEDEARGIASWQIIWKLARQMVPALAGITIALLSIFAYYQMQTPEVSLYKNYDRAFMSDDQSHRMLAAEQKDITYESVLTAIAERSSGNFSNFDSK